MKTVTDTIQNDDGSLEIVYSDGSTECRYPNCDCCEDECGNAMCGGFCTTTGPPCDTSTPSCLRASFGARGLGNCGRLNIYCLDNCPIPTAAFLKSTGGCTYNWRCLQQGCASGPNISMSATLGPGIVSFVIDFGPGLGTLSGSMVIPVVDCDTATGTAYVIPLTGSLNQLFFDNVCSTAPTEVTLEFAGDGCTGNLNCLGCFTGDELDPCKIYKNNDRFRAAAVPCGSGEVPCCKLKACECPYCVCCHQEQWQISYACPEYGVVGIDVVNEPLPPLIFDRLDPLERCFSQVSVIPDPAFPQSDIRLGFSLRCEDGTMIVQAFVNFTPGFGGGTYSSAEVGIGPCPCGVGDCSGIGGTYALIPSSGFCVGTFVTITEIRCQ